ncbi:hypothetical protein RND71_014011 [Anisodus tanguticus]|uniref:Uncharacterized protein n=1 Tax=Anisodus tanguticus TaxID=243964 RepID=A0AAE1VJJ9_9SOLA|nr:hypothetical protein RND71_014011 [Anisodus tanguticus]
MTNKFTRARQYSKKTNKEISGQSWTDPLGRCKIELGITGLHYSSRGDHESINEMRSCSCERRFGTSKANLEFGLTGQPARAKNTHISNMWQTYTKTKVRLKQLDSLSRGVMSTTRHDLAPGFAPALCCGNFTPFCSAFLCCGIFDMVDERTLFSKTDQRVWNNILSVRYNDFLEKARCRARNDLEPELASPTSVSILYLLKFLNNCNLDSLSRGVRSTTRHDLAPGFAPPCAMAVEVSSYCMQRFGLYRKIVLDDGDLGGFNWEFGPVRLGKYLILEKNALPTIKDKIS